MLKCIVQQYVERTINKNWTADFLCRHKDQVLDVYLKDFDRERFAAESVENTEHFFKNVRKCGV